MGDVQPGVVGDDVVVDGEDGLGVRLDPSDLKFTMLQSEIVEREEANIILSKLQIFSLWADSYMSCYTRVLSGTHLKNKPRLNVRKI